MEYPAAIDASKHAVSMLKLNFKLVYILDIET